MIEVLQTIEGFHVKFQTIRSDLVIFHFDKAEDVPYENYLRSKHWEEEDGWTESGHKIFRADGAEIKIHYSGMVEIRVQ